MSISRFCSLRKKRIVAQNELALVKRDGFPLSPGRTLVIRRHVASFFEITLAERSAMLELLANEKREPRSADTNTFSRES